MSDDELLQRFNRLLQPEPSFGLELCKIGLIDALWGSQVERRRYSLRYHQEGRLRLIAETYRGDLHGDFLLFYPDGKIWMRGVYRNGDMISEAMRIFMPDGTLAKGAPSNNVIPFKRKSRPF
jgi:hypothetical protein